MRILVLRIYRLKLFLTLNSEPPMTKVTGFLLHRILHNQVITYERTIVDNPTIINNKTFTHTLFTLVIIEPIENITAKYNNNQKLSISTTVAENPKLPFDSLT